MVLSTLQTAGLLVGILYYITTLRNAQKNRMVDLVFRRMQSSDTEYQKMTRSLEPIMTGWDTVEEFYTKYGYRTEPELTVARVEVQNKLRSWGFLLKEGAVDLDFITRVHSPWYIIRFWESFGKRLSAS